MSRLDEFLPKFFGAGHARSYEVGNKLPEPFSEIKAIGVTPTIPAVELVCDEYDPHHLYHSLIPVKWEHKQNQATTTVKVTALGCPSCGFTKPVDYQEPTK